MGVSALALGFAINTNYKLITRLYVETETRTMTGESTELNCLLELVTLLQQALRLVLLWASRRVMRGLLECQSGCVLNVLYEIKEEDTEIFK